MRGDYFDKTQRKPPNINDNASFSNLTQNPSNSQYNKNKNISSNNT